MGQVYLPDWAQNMREIFRAETISQFVVTGNINDFVLFKDDGKAKFYPLKTYLNEVLFAPFEVVLFYDRGQGIQLSKGGEYFHQYLQVFDKFHGSRFSSDAGAQGDPAEILESPGLLPRQPDQALELIDRFIRNVAVINRTGKKARSVAVVLDYANFIIPRGESLYLSGEIGANLIKILSWGKDPSVTEANIVTVLLAENLADLNEFLVDNSYSAKIQINLPQKEEIEEYVRFLVEGEPDFSKYCEVEIPVLAAKLVGLSRVNIKNLILKAIRNQEMISTKYLSQIKKEIIEKESFGKLEFVESKRTLADVAGQTEAKQWLREDAQLMKKGALHTLPMGYLVTGRIGTGKSFLIECFAGECELPFVALKNFREKWVGATEGNLEKIFSILHALGQVVVFVDEADQITGRRGGGDGDSGLSGRIYGMLAKEMANTENRGKILWIFATSRPDLIEVDLKRQGRLDIHIPLFPPEDSNGKKELFLAMARKLKMDLTLEDLPELKFEEPVSGNELEGLLVRALREYELQPPGSSRIALPDILKKVAREFRPSAYTSQLELMDLLAVKECTDDRFLPSRFLNLDKLHLNKRITELFQYM
jgi:AAA+ superfamily predicted ATPase